MHFFFPHAAEFQKITTPRNAGRDVPRPLEYEIRLASTGFVRDLVVSDLDALLDRLVDVLADRIAARLANGVPVPDDLMVQLRAVVERAGVPFVLA